MQKSFRDLDAFQLGIDLVVMVYQTTDDFPRREIYGLTSQLRRASIGVISQIAEGHGRVTFGERRQFLSQARGSLFEIEAQCLAAMRLHYMTPEQEANITRQIKRTGAALSGLIQYVRAREQPRTTQRPRDPATQ